MKKSYGHPNAEACTCADSQAIDFEYIRNRVPEQTLKNIASMSEEHAALCLRVVNKLMALSPEQLEEFIRLCREEGIELRPARTAAVERLMSV